MAETCCPLILVTTLLLVVKHSTTLSVVTGLVVVWISLTIDTKLLGCDTIKIFCCLWGEHWTITAEDDFETTVEVNPTYVCTEIETYVMLCGQSIVHMYVAMYVLMQDTHTYTYIVI